MTTNVFLSIWFNIYKENRVSARHSTLPYGDSTLTFAFICFGIKLVL